MHVLCLTRFDTGVVLELVAGGTLTLQLSVGHGYSWGTVWANTGVSVAGLRQTKQAARLVSTSIMAWRERLITQCEVLGLKPQTTFLM